MPIMTASRKLSTLTTSVKLFRTKARHIYWLDLLSLSPETHHLSGDVINIPADLLNNKTWLSESQWIVRQLLALCAWIFIRKLSALPFNTLDTWKLLDAIWASWISNFCPTLLVWWVWASAALLISRIKSVAFLLPSQITENLREPGFSALERDFRPIPKLGIAFLRRNSIRWPFGESTR